jgi:hypothetical protein
LRANGECQPAPQPENFHAADYPLIITKRKLTIVLP